MWARGRHYIYKIDISTTIRIITVVLIYGYVKIKRVIIIILILKEAKFERLIKVIYIYTKFY